MCLKRSFFKEKPALFATPKYWKEALNRDFENEPVNTGQPATHPLNISFWTCQQAHSFYVSNTFQNPTSKARLIKVGFTDRSIHVNNVIIV